MTRNRSAPGTVGRELWQQSHPFHHDESKDGGSDFCANPQNNSGTSAGGGPAQEVTTPSAFSAGLSMMASAFSSRPSPAVRARGPHLEARRLRAHTDMGKDAHVRMPGHVGHMPVANMGEHANIPLPREYAEDIGRTPDALESFSRICHLAARGDLEALKRKVAELPPGKLKLAGSLDNRAPLHFAAAAGHVRAAELAASRSAARPFRCLMPHCACPALRLWALRFEARALSRGPLSSLPYRSAAAAGGGVRLAAEPGRADQSGRRLRPDPARRGGALEPQGPGPAAARARRPPVHLGRAGHIPQLRCAGAAAEREHDRRGLGGGRAGAQDGGHDWAGYAAAWPRSLAAASRHPRRPRRSGLHRAVRRCSCEPLPGQATQHACSPPSLL